ncbi:MAG: hypothetical protein RLY87_1127 [Chloroflexota bacterium]|jgi:4-amino-4-deoxy-L-arabinose transferase-like glycosyltransferase
MLPDRSWKTSLWLGLCVAVCTFSVVFVSQPAIGLTWDEPAYMQAAQSYHTWYTRLCDESALILTQPLIDAYWSANHEHPPLVKIWYALVATPLVEAWGVIDAYRTAAMLLSTALVTMLAISLVRVIGLWSALAGVLLLLALPRVFFHLHVAALDVPGALAYIAGILFFWHLRNRRERRFDVLFGIIWGLGIATKINAAFVLPAVGLWWLITDRRWFTARRIVVASGIGVGVFFVSWPWLWVDPIRRSTEYLRWITVDHWQIPQWFLGQSVLPPPWYFAPVMAVMTTPALYLILVMVLPFIALPPQRSYLTMLGIGAILPLVALMGSTTVYDNERLFLATFPLVAALAGISLTRLAQLWSRGVALDRRIWSVVLSCVLIVPLFQSYVLWPHLLSYYSTVIGGLHGAQRISMDHTYWNETYADALTYLDTYAPAQATIWIEPWSYDVPHTYQKDNRIRADLRFVSDNGASVWGMPTTQMASYEADYILVTYRFAGWTPAIQALVRGNSIPVYVVTRNGIPLAAVYRNP